MKDEMKMPGFTADASLYKPRRHYNLGVNRSVDGQVVIPQIGLDYPICFTHLEPGPGECCYRIVTNGGIHFKLVCSIW